MMRAVVVALIFAACTGGGGGGDDEPAVDAPAGDVDMPSGNACVMAAYDPCTGNGDCTSGNCHFFMQSGFSVCTQACTPGDDSTCPVDSSGANAKCNNMGICKPAAPNNCTP